MSEEQEFWDDFAAEYAEIQQESQLTIAGSSNIFKDKRNFANKLFC